jgi:hypothetical protein
MSEVNSTEIEYRDIPGFPGYRAGSDGSIWSCRTTRGGTSSRWNRMKATITQRSSAGRTYCHLNLYSNRVAHTFKVHYLILITFIGARPPGSECRHLDGNPLNNRSDNLCWGTPTENTLDRIRHGRIAKGNDHSMAKLNSDQVREIRLRFGAGGVTKNDLAIEYGVTRTVIRNVITRQAWKHVV